MDPTGIAAPSAARPTGDELLAELRQRARVTPRPERVIALTTLDITLEEATTLYAALCRKMERPPKPRRGSGEAKLPAELFCVWRDLLENQVRRIPETHPFGRKKPRRVQLEILPTEAGYLMRMVRNRQRDEARKESAYNALKTEEERRRKDRLEAGRKPSRPASLAPTLAAEQEADLGLEELARAIESCPRGPELAAYLPWAEGNVSRLARHFGEPQRTVAHAVARLRKHLLAQGYSA